jgi:hypothetical protein
MSPVEHYDSALKLQRQSPDSVSLEEARHLLAANDDPHDPVCMTTEHRHRVLTTLIALLEEKAPR